VAGLSAERGHSVDDLQATYAASKEQRWRKRWDESVRATSADYNWLVNDGMPAEDARGLAPTNVTTRIEYVTDLRSLLDHGGNRLCTQAQFEWKQVWAQIIQAIAGYAKAYIISCHLCGQVWQADQPGGYDYDSIKCQCVAGSEPEFTTRDNPVRWQFEAISKLFKPACYLTGKCEFAAMDLDRKCSIRNRVEANHEVGRDSAEWGTELDRVEGNPIVAGVGPRSVMRNEQGVPVFIGAIQPREWAADPAAAR
jgi:hypothetical protein